MAATKEEMTEEKKRENLENLELEAIGGTEWQEQAVALREFIPSKGKALTDREYRLTLLRESGLVVAQHIRAITMTKILVPTPGTLMVPQVQKRWAPMTSRP